LPVTISVDLTKMDRTHLTTLNITGVNGVSEA